MMITIRDGAKRFNHRTAGVFLDDGHVLLHRFEQDDFWALPGGRVEFMETTKQAVLREMQEEIGLEATVERLLFIAEIHSEEDGGQYHEVGFYYLLRADASQPIFRKDIAHRGTEAGTPLIYKWFRLEDLPGLRLFPTFLKTKLQDLPAQAEHVIHRDEDDQA
ncbi:ADP-ribose pyrophosphatase YjhB (NUDIX family) [Tumebacillus sp. BK434]|uniref:NUDIX hydrolase n=1 Tax=Tumebacillus sp. BK434 TaxID=2512169 RepID=UPI001043D422|nr:NUDIX hydrolase [Tumebacillus sp. BK434]TCP59444.1 ADP-ribose pyrophosphatase YjhB (NUDIX family) [Tumebacillus sp. BK434]